MITTIKEAMDAFCCVDGCGKMGKNGRRYCEGSRCMGWRWYDEKPQPQRITVHGNNVNELADEPAARPTDVPASYTFERGTTAFWSPSSYVEPQEEADDRATGYCGRASEP